MKFVFLGETCAGALLPNQRLIAGEATTQIIFYLSRCVSLTASSPVARDHWGIFELIIKESGDQSPPSPGKACGGGSQFHVRRK